MRILHLSDTHLGAELRARGVPSGWRRADDHLRAMEAALTPALTGEVDLVVHTGDVFDRSNPPEDAIGAAVVLLHRVARAVPVVLIPGNHDRRGLEPHLGDRPGIRVCDAPTRIELRGAALGFVPFYRDSADWGQAARIASEGGVDLLFAHQSFHGSRVPGFTFRGETMPETVREADLPPGVRWVATGHIHPRQILRLGQATVVHCGSTEKTSFSEQDETKGYTIWELGREPSWRFVDLPSRPMRWVTSVSQIQSLEPGLLVGLHRDLRCWENEEAALARGVWLTGRPSRAPKPAPRAAGPQRDLFGRG